jgi:hypothetical protein
MKTNRDKVVTVRMSSQLLEQVNKSASEDFRKQSDEINYLLTVGLAERQRQKAEERRLQEEYVEVDS